MQKMMFTKGLTQAVLEDLKTNTRRIIKVPDTWHGIDVYGVGPDTDGQSLLLYDADGYLIEDPKTHQCGQIMPKYKVGEVVAVAQCYKDFRWPAPQRSGFQEILHSAGWSNKMFVRAELMPHQIRITSVRIERLQDISDEDCLREGIYWKTCCPPGDINYFYHSEPKSKYEVYPTPRDAFAGLIDKVSGKGTWESNPWVYVYEFEKVR